MKRGGVLLCMMALCFGCADPPIAEVMGHNLEPTFLNSLMDNVPDELELNPESNPVYFNATLVGVFPSVDDRIPVDANPWGHKILWTWGENYTNYTIKDTMEVTTGNNSCTYTNVTLFMREDRTTYNFRVKVDNETIAAYTSKPENIPLFDLNLGEERLQRYNATEKMEVRLEYVVKYFYTDMKNCGMSPVELQVVVEVGGHSELHYYVENGNVVFFTVRPVLGEQWFHNNHFDNLVFSKKKFYKGEVYLDGNKTGEACIYNFSRYEGTGGAWFINSSQENEYGNTTLEEYELIYEPIPMVRENESFRYLYEQNYSYGGFGYHNLSLVLTNHFLNRYEYNRTLLSRAAGELEAREEEVYTLEGNATTYYMRPTYKEAEPELQQVLIPSWALAIIFIVVVAGGWWSTTKARVG